MLPNVPFQKKLKSNFLTDGILLLHYLK